MEHKLIFVGLFLILLLSFGFAFVTYQTHYAPNIIEFKDSSWNYIMGYGFVDDKTVEFLKEREFVERSRNYFLERIK